MNGNGMQKRQLPSVGYLVGKLLAGVVSLVILAIVGVVAAFLVGAAGAFVVRGFQTTCDWLGC